MFPEIPKCSLILDRQDRSFSELCAHILVSGYFELITKINLIYPTNTTFKTRIVFAHRYLGSDSSGKITQTFP